MASLSMDPALQAPEIDPELTNGLAKQPPADVDMTDSSAAPQQAPEQQDQQPSLQPTVQTQPPTAASTPLPPSAPTLPTASSRNSPQPRAQAPTQPIPHGSPTRVYLNQNVTPHLLEAMKHLATNEPDKPLKWLSEFLARKSLEVEGP